MNETFKNSRSGFTFTVGDLAVVTFSGLGDQQVKKTADDVVQPVDRILFTLLGAGTPPKIAPAVGSCSFSNPYIGSMVVACSATTKAGRYVGKFVTDGRAPSVKSFD